MTEERYAYTRQEAADYLRVSVRTINRLIAAGTLPSAKIGGRRLIPTDALHRLLHTNDTTKAAS